MPSSSTWLSVNERPPPPPKADGRALAVRVRLSDGREVLAKSERGGIRLLGGQRGRVRQLSFDDLATIEAWQPLDERQLEDFENGD